MKAVERGKCKRNSTSVFQLHSTFGTSVWIIQQLYSHARVLINGFCISAIVNDFEALRSAVGFDTQLCSKSLYRDPLFASFIRIYQFTPSDWDHDNKLSAYFSTYRKKSIWYKSRKYKIK